MPDALAGSSAVDQRTRPQTQDRGLTDILSATLQENLVFAYLSNLRDHINPHTILATKHIQLLLYLTLNPPPKTTPHDLDPLILLQRVLSFHSPTDLAQSLPSVSLARDGPPIWLRWAANQGVETTLKKALSKCVEDGIWGFVWKYGGRAEIVEDAVGMDDGEELDEDVEEEELGELNRGKEARLVSERGWELLAWFCDVWEKDRLEHDNGHSPMLLDQLPHHYGSTLKLSDAQQPLSIVLAGMRRTASEKYEMGSRHRDVGKRIFDLLLISAQGLNPPFNPPSLALSIIYVFRDLPSCQTFTQLLTFSSSSAIQWNIPLHLVMLFVEDLAGTRSARSQARSKGQSDTTQLDDTIEGFGKLPPPTWEYVMELMTMKVITGWKGVKGEEKMGWGKLFLLSSMMARNAGSDQIGALAFGSDWTAQVESSMADLGEEGGYKRTILSLAGLIQR